MVNPHQEDLILILRKTNLGSCATLLTNVSQVGSCSAGGDGGNADLVIGFAVVFYERDGVCYCDMSSRMMLQ